MDHIEESAKADRSANEKIEKWLSYFEKVGEKVSYNAGHTFIMEGSRAECFYIILSGRVISYRYSESGVMFEYWSNNQHKEDRTIGIPAALTGSLYEVSVKALSACELIKVNREDLIAVMSENPDASIAIATLISSKFIHTNSILHDYAELNSYQRFYKFLLRMSDHGEKVPGGILVKTRLNQLHMAELLKLNRTTIYRACQKLQNEGICDCAEGSFFIKDIEKLKALISQ